MSAGDYNKCPHINNWRQKMSDNGKQSNDDFLKDQVDKYKILYKTYDEFALCLCSIFEEMVKPVAPLAIIQSRPKSVSSFAEKIQRKKKYDNPIKQFTDLCGARIIVHTRSQVEKVCRIINDNFEIDIDNCEDKEELLKPDEFGYISKHYIVSINQNSFIISKFKNVDFTDFYDLKVEVQVRTMLQHAWADIQHDFAYKGDFALPREMVRGLNRLSAMLEEADKDFDRIIGSLKDYHSNYGAYLSAEQIKEEIKILDVICAQAPDPQIALRIGKLAMCLEDWQMVIVTLTAFADSNIPEVRKDLGISMCKKYGKETNPDMYECGRKYIEEAWELSVHTDVDAVTALAKVWVDDDPQKSCEFYKQAYDLDPTDPYVLDNYLNQEIISRKDPSIIFIAAPIIRESIEKCNALAKVGINMPWSYFSMGKFRLLKGELTGSIDAYAKGILMSSAPWMLETALSSLNRLCESGVIIQGIDVIKNILILGLVARFNNEDAKKLLMPNLDTAIDNSKPVAVVYSSTDGLCDSALVTPGVFTGLFDRFNGLVLDGLKSLQSVDQSHSIISTFTIDDVVKNWVSLLASGLTPDQIKVFGTGCTDLCGVGYRLALALGCQVGLIEHSGGEASLVLSDVFWCNAQLLSLFEDKYVLSAFLNDNSVNFNDEDIDNMAKAIHSQHRNDILSSIGDPARTSDPALWEWENLGSCEKGIRLQESSRDSVRDIIRKLKLLGYDAVCTFNQSLELNDEEYEELAMMEHARWTLERLRKGWRFGEEKDSERKISPYLIEWEKLDETAKDWDRNIVRQIPILLNTVGFKIVK
jgi:ppGpp synthetase/RelA/SpoT-type nucleotidyltranferase